MRSIVSHIDDSYSAEEYANLELALINRASDVISEVEIIDTSSDVEDKRVRIRRAIDLALQFEEQQRTRQEQALKEHKEYYQRQQ